MSKYPSVRIARGKITHLIMKDGKITGFEVKESNQRYHILSLDAKQMGSLFVSLKRNRESLDFDECTFYPIREER